MDPLTIGLILGIVGFVGGLITNGVNSTNVRHTNQSNQDIAQQTNEASALLAQQQHQWNVEDYERELRDSSPQVQMQRFRDAGLNPALIYGQMSSGPSIESTNMPSMTAIPNQAFQAVDPTQSLQNSASDMLSIAQARKAEVEASVMEQKLPHEVRVLNATAEQLHTQINEINASVAEIQRRIQSMDIEDQLKLAQKARIEFESKLDSENFELAKKQFEQDVLESNSRIRLNNAQRDNFNALTKISNREYLEMLRTWRYRLLGFDLENQRLQQALNLGEVEIENARKNGEILGFQIDNGRIDSYFDKEVYDDLSGKNGWYHYYKTKMNLKLARDVKSFGESGRLLFRVGK